MIYMRSNELIKLFNFFRHNSNNKYEFKIKTLILVTVTFSLIYLFLDDLDFHGVNVVQEKIKEIGRAHV